MIKRLAEFPYYPLLVIYGCLTAFFNPHVQILVLSPVLFAWAIVLATRRYYHLTAYSGSNKPTVTYRSMGLPIFFVIIQGVLLIFNLSSIWIMVTDWGVRGHAVQFLLIYIQGIIVYAQENTKIRKVEEN